MFLELGRSCSCVIAVQVGFGKLSPARRWLLQFVVSSIDVYFSLNSLLILAKASLTSMWSTSQKTIAIIALNFHMPSAWRLWDTQFNKTRSSSSLFLGVPSCTSSCLALLQSCGTWAMETGVFWVWGKNICLFSWSRSSAATKQTVKPQPQEAPDSKAGCEKQENP